MYQRIIYDDIVKKCFHGKAIIIYGPRQVGKTTLMRQIQHSLHERKALYLSGDDRETQQTLEPSLRILTTMISPYDLIMIDEAQRIVDI
jgi:predicted AAA+ superfamily ATPase